MLKFVSNVSKVNDLMMKEIVINLYYKSHIC